MARLAAEAPSPTSPATNPLTARDAGYDRIATLEREGDFAATASFALDAAPALRRDLIIAAFVDWGARDPEPALDRAIAVPDPNTRTLAFESVLTGWARQDPAELANVSVRFPRGPERDAALTKALREWMHRDPWTAGDWLLAQARDVQDIAARMFDAENR